MTRSGRTPLSRLIVMTRFPAPGCAKTRLAPVLGEEGAAALHSDLARHCVRRMHAAALSGAAELEIRATGAPARAVRRWLGRDVPVREQCGGDLGARLAAAAHSALASGVPSVVLVGSDAPDLSGAHVRAALEALDGRGADVALGPATDGGYYLASVSARSADRALTALFGDHIPWGTERVLDVTLAALRASGLAVHLLEDALPDVDRPDDLAVWDRFLVEEERVRTQARLSVVIPALNEKADIAEAVASAREAGACEVIVADGGSSDGTADLATRAGARVVRTERGRARQLNAGAAVATGDILLFLHADTRLPAGAHAHVQRVLSDPHVVLGSFRFAAGDPDSLLDRLISGIGSWRHRVFRLPYGDQGAFVRTRDFLDLGGFPDLPVMEDYEFALRCSRLGGLAVAPAVARTSARAWHDHGVLRTTLTNATVIAGYRLGISPETLATWRRRIAGRNGPDTTAAPLSEGGLL